MRRVLVSLTAFASAAERQKAWRWPRQVLGWQGWQDFDTNDGKFGESSWALSGVDVLQLLQCNMYPAACFNQSNRSTSEHGLEGLLINIGAGDGCLFNWGRKNARGELIGHCDPVNGAFEPSSGFPRLRGLLIEPMNESATLLQLRFAWTNDNVRVVTEAATAEMLQRLLLEEDACLGSGSEKGSCRRIPVAVKVDTDSFDCEMVEFLLSIGLLPMFWYVEINPLYPPPVRYVYFGQVRPDYAWPPHSKKLGDSCSLSYMSDLLRPHGYVLLQLDWCNAIYVLGQLAKGLGDRPLDDFEAFYFGWAARPRITDFLNWATWTRRETTEYWRNMFAEHVKIALRNGSSCSQWHAGGRDALQWEAWVHASQNSGGEPFSVRVPLDGWNVFGCQARQ